MIKKNWIDFFNDQLEYSIENLIFIKFSKIETKLEKFPHSK